MRDVDTLVKVIHQIELILAEHVEPGQLSDPEGTAALSRHSELREAI
jgi:hypothetical protein